MEFDIQVGDYGVAIRFWFTDSGEVVDISTAIAMVMYMVPPTKPFTLVTKTCVHVTDGTDGGMQYILVPGDIPSARGWRVQGKVTLPTSAHSTTIYTLNVGPVLT